MTNELHPQPIATPSVEMPQNSSTFRVDYEGRRRRDGADGMVIEGEHQTALLFGVNALQGPERIDYTTEVDTAAIDEETRRHLQEAQDRLDSWEDETPERAIVVDKIISVARRRDEVRGSDTRKFRLFTEIMPQAQQERDDALGQLQLRAAERSKANQEFQEADQVLEYYDEENETWHGIIPDIRTTEGLIKDAVALRKDIKERHAKFHERYLEFCLGHTKDGGTPEPLSEFERDAWIVDGVAYGPLATTEADADYIPDSPQETERVKAVLVRIMQDYDAETARVNKYINEQRQLRDEANVRKRQAEMERVSRHEALLQVHLNYSNSEWMAEEAEGRYTEASKLRHRIIGKPDETFGDQVERELRQDKAKAALDQAQQQRVVTFGSAGPRSEADMLAGRVPLAIEGAKIAVQGIAARVKIRGIGRTAEITVGYPKERE